MSTNQNGFWTDFTSLDEIFAVEVQSWGGGGGGGGSHLEPEMTLRYWRGRSLKIFSSALRASVCNFSPG